MLPLKSRNSRGRLRPLSPYERSEQDAGTLPSRSGLEKDGPADHQGAGQSGTGFPRRGAAVVSAGRAGPRSWGSGREESLRLVLAAPPGWYKAGLMQGERQGNALDRLVTRSFQKSRSFKHRPLWPLQYSIGPKKASERGKLQALSAHHGSLTRPQTPMDCPLPSLTNAPQLHGPHFPRWMS